MSAADEVRRGGTDGGPRGTDRALIGASAAVAFAAVVARLHDIVAYPALRDWDASGHAVNVLEILEGRLPDPRGWSGSHPPVYYALGGLLSALLPDAIPIHVTLRLVSVAAWLGVVALIWRALRAIAPEPDAAVVSALLLGVPGFLIASCMMTNDALCAFFATAVLVRLLEARGGETRPPSHAVVTGVLAGLAAATKATGMAAVAVALVFYAWQARIAPWRAVVNVAAAGLAGATIAVPHYARLVVSLSGSTARILGGRAGSWEKEVLSAVVLATMATRGESPAAVFHAALWGDPTAVYLPEGLGWMGEALEAGGLLVAALVCAGVLRLFVERDLASRAWAPLVFGLMYVGALAWPTIQGPHFMLTKTSYMLPLALPVAITLVAGLRWCPRVPKQCVGALLLLLAAGGVGATWYGWWEPADAGAPSRESRADPGSPTGAVLRYFADRSRDPIRAAWILAARWHLAHELRLVRILGLDASEPTGLSPEARESVELARARMAWLELYNLVRWMQPIAAGLSVAEVDVIETGDRAEVRARIEARGAEAPAGGEIGRWPFPPFLQLVSLERSHGSWRIVDLRQEGVENENLVQAVVAQPTLAGLERLRALGWRPPWEGAIPKVVPPLP